MHLRYFPALFILGILFFPGADSSAAVARSATYSLDYATVSAGGAANQSSHYQVVSVVRTEGPAGETGSSSHYTVQTAVGMTDTPSAITDWALY